MIIGNLYRYIYSDSDYLSSCPLLFRTLCLDIIYPRLVGGGREHSIAHRVGRFLERQGLQEWDAENSHLAGDKVDDDPMTQLLSHSITYRIAVGPQAGRKVFTLQTLPACAPEDQFAETIGQTAGTVRANSSQLPLDLGKTGVYSPYIPQWLRREPANPR